MTGPRLLLALLVASPAARARAAETAAPPEAARAWTAYSSGQMLAAFPGLAPLAGTDLNRLKSVLNETPLRPEALAHVEPPAQLDLVRRDIRDHARAALASAREIASAPERGPAGLEALSRLHERMQDLASLSGSGLLDDEDAKALSAALPEVRGTLHRDSRRLIEEKVKLLAGSEGLSWQGRTAFIPLEGGAVLAFKTSNNLTALRDEARQMAFAGRLGLRAPVPLATRASDPVVSYMGEFPAGSSAKGHELLAYLLPKALAEDYRAYLNAAPPAGLTLEERTRRVEQGALRAIDDMVLLLKAGHAHGSLAALSHASEHWEWDYWRWVWPVLGKMRFGPSFIHDWKASLAYPNLRLSGLADFEHVQALSDLETTHRHGERLYARHDAYSAVGQNLAEWAFIVMRAGAASGLKGAATAKIIVDGLTRHADAVLAAEAAAGLKRRMRSMAWDVRFAVARVGALSALLSFPPAALALDVVALLSQQGENGKAMPGWALHPLIMNVLRPYAASLREHAALGESLRRDQPLSRSDLGFGYALGLLCVTSLCVGMLALSILLIAAVLGWAPALSALGEKGMPYTVLASFSGVLVLWPFWLIGEGAFLAGRVVLELAGRAISGVRARLRF